MPTGHLCRALLHPNRPPLLHPHCVLISTVRGGLTRPPPLGSRTIPFQDMSKSPAGVTAGDATNGFRQMRRNPFEREFTAGDATNGFRQKRRNPLELPKIAPVVPAT